MVDSSSDSDQEVVACKLPEVPEFPFPDQPDSLVDDIMAGPSVGCLAFTAMGTELVGSLCEALVRTVSTSHEEACGLTTKGEGATPALGQPAGPVAADGTQDDHAQFTPVLTKKEKKFKKKEKKEEKKRQALLLTGAVGTASAAPPCVHFLRGTCWYGAQCRFSHHVGGKSRLSEEGWRPPPCAVQKPVDEMTDSSTSKWQAMLGHYISKAEHAHAVGNDEDAEIFSSMAETLMALANSGMEMPELAS